MNEEELEYLGLTAKLADSTVEHPHHYNQYKGFEVIDVCKQLGFMKGNAFKYIARAGFKPVGDRRKELEDLRKAKRYIELEIAEVTEALERETQEELETEPLVDALIKARVSEDRWTKIWPGRNTLSKYHFKNTKEFVEAVQYDGKNWEIVFELFEIPKPWFSPGHIEAPGVLWMHPFEQFKEVSIKIGDWILKIPGTYTQASVRSDESFAKEYEPFRIQVSDSHEAKK